MVQVGPNGQPQQIYAQTPQGQVVVQMQPGMQPGMQPQVQVQMQPQQQMQMQPQMQPQMQVQMQPQVQMASARREYFEQLCVRVQQTGPVPGVPEQYASQVPPMTGEAS